MRAESQAEGYAVGRYALRSRGLRALSARPYCPRTPVAGPTAVEVENLLLGQPAPTVPNQMWLGESPSCPWSAPVISSHLTGYLLAAGRRLVQVLTKLLITILKQALTLRQPAPGVIIYADRGSQYTTASRARIEEA